MNLQTIKPRARLVRRVKCAVVWGSGSSTEVMELWRVFFPGSNVGACGGTIAAATELAYRARLAYLTGASE